MNNYFADNGKPIRCIKCDGVSIQSIIKEYIRGHAAEILYQCTTCHTDLGYWAYGYFDPRYEYPGKQQ